MISKKELIDEIRNIRKDSYELCTYMTKNDVCIPNNLINILNSVDNILKNID